MDGDDVQSCICPQIVLVPWVGHVCPSAGLVAGTRVSQSVPVNAGTVGGTRVSQVALVSWILQAFHIALAS